MMKKIHEAQLKSDSFIVNPWEVKGAIDYDRLIKQFGMSPMGNLPKVFTEHHLFRRKYIFAHRDFERIVDAVTKKKPFALLTGLMPSGKLHLGHMLVAQQFIFYQKLGAKLHICVADIESYNTRNMPLDQGRKTALEEYLTNYIALGLKKKNCDFYFQSNRSKNQKKANAYYRLQNMLAKYITFNELNSLYGDLTNSKIMCGLLQAADILHPQLPEFEGPMPLIVPVGTDQDPHLRMTRDIAKRIKNPRFTQVSSTYHKLIPALKGPKMSSSDTSSYIALTDTPEEATKKIKKYAFSGGRATLEEHRKYGGNPDIDVSFQYLKAIFEPNDKKLQKIYDDYKSGALLSGDLKAILVDKVADFLKSHHRKREQAKKKIDSFLD